MLSHEKSKKNLPPGTELRQDSDKRADLRESQQGKPFHVNTELRAAHSRV